MSIQVSEITKIYGKQKALDAVSLQVKSGEIVGLLGPNGAGKSTLMKILSCYIPATSGKAMVAGFDCETDSLDVRRRIGYLPETNPLYYDMYVVEYLKFVGRIYKLKDLNNRVKEVVEMTALGKEMHKKIGALSKGYKQRVGLAQAFIHNPEVLILDEPTSGLDPNQIIEIRNLIKEIGKSKTVIFSSHIMQEVEAVCQRVIIINGGKIIADSPTHDLQKLWQEKELIYISFKENVDIQLISAIDREVSVEKSGQKSFKMTAKAGSDVREKIYEFARDNKFTLIEMRSEEVKLEDIFQKLTQPSNR